MEQHKKKYSEEVKIKKKHLYIGSILVLTLLVGGYFMISKPKPSDFSTIKKDSTNLTKQDSLTTGEIEHEDYIEYHIIAPSITLSDGQVLKFGDKVYESYADFESNHLAKNVFLLPSNTGKNAPKYLINESALIEAHQFNKYKMKFSLPPFNTLPSYMKKALMQEDGQRYDGVEYSITQNAERAKNTLAIGDYDGDGMDDIAAILDNNEKQESRLIVIATNKATKTAYLAFAHNYILKVKVKTLAKSSNIYMNSSDLVKSPQESIMIYNNDDSYNQQVVIYDKKRQMFSVYEQQPTKESDEDAPFDYE